MNAIICPQCGSGELQPLGLNRLRCFHCGVTSVQDQNGDVLSILIWACPKCGFDNEKQSDYCGKCGNSLTRQCPRCGSSVRWDLKFCSSCQFHFFDNEAIVKIFSWLPFSTGVLTSHRIIRDDAGNYFEILISDITSVVFKHSKLSNSDDYTIIAKDKKHTIITMGLSDSGKNCSLRKVIENYHGQGGARRIYSQNRTSWKKSCLGCSVVIIALIITLYSLLIQ